MRNKWTRKKMLRHSCFMCKKFYVFFFWRCCFCRIRLFAKSVHSKRIYLLKQTECADRSDARVRFRAEIICFAYTSSVFAIEDENDLYAEFVHSFVHLSFFLSFLLSEIVFVWFFSNGFCNIDIDWVQMLNGTTEIYTISKNHETSSENSVLR